MCSAIATVYQPVDFEESHVSLGTLERGTTLSFSKKLYVNTTPAEKQRYQILNLEAPRGIMKASLSPREERELGNQVLQKTYDVKVDILPNATTQPGKGSGALILTYADQNGAGGTIVMNISWTTPEHLQITPHRIAFGSITGKHSEMQKDAILERLSDSEPGFRIIRAVSSHPGLSIVSTEAIAGTDGRRYRIRVALDPTRFDHFFSESITIMTNHPLAPSIRLPVIAYKTRTQEKVRQRPE